MLANMIRLRWICLLLLISCVAGCPGTPQLKSAGIVHEAQDTMKQMDYVTSVEELKRSLRIWPENYAADFYLGWIYATCPDGRFLDGEKALMHARRALETRSCEEDYRERLSVFGLAVVAAAEARMGDFEAAVRTQEMAIESLARSDMKERDRYLPRYRSILEVYEAEMPLTTPYISPETVTTPGWAMIASKRGEDAVLNGDYQGAVDAFEDLAPRYPAGEMRLAWIYATCPDPKWRNPREAVDRAARALKTGLEHKAQDYMGMFDWELLATLAAAHAEAGDFEKAVKIQEYSLRGTKYAAPAARDKARKIAVAVLELYRAGRPLRAKGVSPIHLDPEDVRKILKNRE